MSSECKHPKNLLVIMVDQMRLQAMEFWNSPHFELNTVNDPVLTPNLNRLASESLVLSQAVSNTPVCSPYRAIFYSGRYPRQNGVPANCNSRTAPWQCELKEDLQCWTDLLAAQGYSLGHIGKWHLDAPHSPYVDCYNNRGKTAWNEWCPPHRRHGFQFWYSYGTYDRHLNPMYWKTEASREEYHFVDQWGPEHEADLALQYLVNEDGKYRNPETPFALVVSMNPPHTPFDQVPQRYLERYQHRSIAELLNRPNVPPLDSCPPQARHAATHIREYFAMVTGIDEQVGRILDGLDQLGLQNDTIVLFISDHGCCMGSHGHAFKNVWYAESALIPFLIRCPGVIPPRHEPSLICNGFDIYPTLLDLLGYPLSDTGSLPGRSLAPVFRGEVPVDNNAVAPLFFYQTDPVNWNEPFVEDHLDYGGRGVRTNRYTFVIQFSPSDTQARIELYDHQNDPYEMNNIAAEQPDLCRQLFETVLAPIMHEAGDSKWVETARSLLERQSS
ncbi:MAG: DUF229 domain-containing protein [Lentisphaerae bacterium]|nr:MAG: DUF229 domain-containing protein [Lentisphaerota bacterium]